MVSKKLKKSTKCSAKELREKEIDRLIADLRKYEVGSTPSSEVWAKLKL